jgi:hypothetical protein
MARQYSTALRTAKQAAIETTVGTSPKLRIYTGSVPANCAAARTGTMLVEMTLPSDWASQSSGQTTKVGTWSGTAGNTGTAGYYSLMDSAGTTCHEQGTVGTSGTDMIIDNTSIASSQVVTVTGYTITEAGA